MTICIAAIAKDGKDECVVFATDHMITIDIGQYGAQVLGKFEHSIKKYRIIPPNTVAMLAGDPSYFNSIIQVPRGATKYNKIQKEIFKNIKNLKDEEIQNQILDVFNLDKNSLKVVLESNTQNPINEPMEDVINLITKFYLDAHVLLIGFEDNLARICEITENTCTDETDIHFTAIGSGYIQATNTLFFQRHTKKCSLKETIYNVFKAKSNAQVHEGVGEKTDLLILRKSGCTKLTKRQMDILKDIYIDELKAGRTDPRLDDLRIEEEFETCL